MSWSPQPCQRYYNLMICDVTNDDNLVSMVPNQKDSITWMCVVCLLNFSSSVLKGVSNAGGHHGIAQLGKCHNNFLVPVFWPQFSRNLLSAGSFGSKNFFQSIVWCISLRVSTQCFCHYRLGLKTTAVDFFTFSKLLYPHRAQTSSHILK